MIKIAFVIDAIYLPTGGTERQLLLLLKHIDRTRFSPTLCILRSSEWIEKEFDICPLYNVDIVSLKSPGAWSRIWEFSRFLKKEGFQIVQTHFNDSNKVGVLAARLAGIRGIISSRRNQGYWHTSIEKGILNILNRWVDTFVANSLSTRDWACRVEGIPKEKIQVIYNALDVEQFSAVVSDARQRIRASLGIPESAFVAGMVANLRPVKAIDTFIEAAGKIRDRMPGAFFVVAGSAAKDGAPDGLGPEERRLYSLVRSLGLTESFKFLGERRDVNELLASFDAGVLTSSSESFSNSLVEYVAAGLPVVTTDVGGAREVVSDGGNGYIVPTADSAAVAEALIRVANGRLDKRNLLEWKAWVQGRFTCKEITSSFERIYQEITNRSQKGAPVSNGI